MENISWYLLEDFNEKPSLFQNADNLEYKVITHICSCGKTNTSLASYFQNEEYQCNECGNEVFYDANAANKNFELFLLNNSIKISLKQETVLEEERVVASYYLSLPNKTDFIREKIHYIKKRIFAYSLTNNAEYDYVYELDPQYPLYSPKLTICDMGDLDDVKTVLQNMVHKFILENRLFNIDRIENYKIVSFFELLFFLENPLLKTRAFYRQRKTINSYCNDFSSNVSQEDLEKILIELKVSKASKKAIYTNISNQINYRKSSILNFIVAFSYSIDDENILQRLISLELEKKYTLPYKEVIALVCFFIEHYTLKQIYSFFASVLKEENQNIFYDLVSIFCLLKDRDELKNFQKVGCKLNPIHDQLLKIYNKVIEASLKSTHFTYSKNEKKAAMPFEGYNIKLPQNGLELKSWGYALHNCLITYAPKIENKVSFIYAFFKHTKIEFAIEVQQGKIIQKSTFNNQPLNKKQEIILKKWRVKYLNKSFYRQNMTKKERTIPVEIIY